MNNSTTEPTSLNLPTGPSAGPSTARGTQARTMDVVNKGLARRYRSERRFRRLGLSAILLSLAFLAVLFISIFANGYTAFKQTFIQLEVFLDPGVIDKEDLGAANYMGLVKKSLTTDFPQVKSRADKRKLYRLVSTGAAFDLQDFVQKNRHEIGNTIRIWMPADDDVDMFMKGHISRDVPEIERRMNDTQIAWVDQFLGQSRIKQEFNTTFFTGGDSREPELAGIWGGLSADHCIPFL